MSFETVAPIEVRPFPHITFQAYAGEEAESRLLLHRADGKPLKVEAVKIVGDGDFEVTTEAVTEPTTMPSTNAAGAPGPGPRELKAQPGDVWILAKVKAPQQRSTFRATAEIKVDHPELEVLSIPMTLVVTDLIQVAPHFTRLWVSDDSPQGAKGRTVTTTLRHRKDKAFEIEGVEVSHPDLFVAKPSTEGAQTVHTVVVSLRDDIDAARIASPIRAAVKVKTSDAEVPEVEVNVMISQSRGLANRPPAGQRRGEPRRVLPVQPSPEAPHEPPKPAGEKEKQ